MCGIAGIINFDQRPVDKDILKDMVDSQRHRGPDDSGILVSGPAGLGHRRLSIIDLSKDAAQPMTNEDSTVVVMHNGEVYNYREIRDELKKFSDELYITTDDGSYGKGGLVTDTLKGLLTVIEKSTHSKYPDLVYTVGPVAMMRTVSELTKLYQIKTIVSLNPIMVDATGMCGSCRVSVGGKTMFGCVDGPEFDGHLVDFAELQKRLNSFKEKEECLNKMCPRKE